MWYTFKDELPEEGRPIAFVSVDIIADYADDVMIEGTSEVFQTAGEYHGACIEIGFARQLGIGGVVIFRTNGNKSEQLGEWEHSRLDRWCYVAELLKASGIDYPNLHTVGDQPWDGNIKGNVFLP